MQYCTDARAPTRALADAPGRAASKHAGPTMGTGPAMYDSLDRSQREPQEQATYSHLSSAPVANASPGMYDRLDRTQRSVGDVAVPLLPPRRQGADAAGATAPGVYMKSKAEQSVLVLKSAQRPDAGGAQIQRIDGYADFGDQAQRRDTSL